MSELREQMIADMRSQGLSASTPGGRAKRTRDGRVKTYQARVNWAA